MSFDPSKTYNAVVALAGFEGFDQTPLFLEKGSQTPQYLEQW